MQRVERLINLESSLTVRDVTKRARRNPCHGTLDLFNLITVEPRHPNIQRCRSRDKNKGSRHPRGKTYVSVIER